MMRNSRLVLIAAVLALVIAACGGDAETTTTTEPATTPTTAAPTATTAAPTTTEAPVAGAPMIPSDHAGRTECFVCHAEGVGGAPKAPSEPDHSAFADDRAVCTGCHSEG